MAKCKLLTNYAGPNGAARAGKVLEAPSEEVDRLVEAGFAQRLGAKAETASEEAPETASRRRSRATAEA